MTTADEKWARMLDSLASRASDLRRSADVLDAAEPKTSSSELALAMIRGSSALRDKADRIDESVSVSRDAIR